MSLRSLRYRESNVVQGPPKFQGRSKSRTVCIKVVKECDEDEYVDIEEEEGEEEQAQHKVSDDNSVNYFSPLQNLGTCNVENNQQKEKARSCDFAEPENVQGQGLRQESESGELASEQRKTTGGVKGTSSALSAKPTQQLNGGADFQEANIDTLEVPSNVIVQISQPKEPEGNGSSSSCRGLGNSSKTRRESAFPWRGMHALPHGFKHLPPNPQADAPHGKNLSGPAMALVLSADNSGLHSTTQGHDDPSPMEVDAVVERTPLEGHLEPDDHSDRIRISGHSLSALATSNQFTSTTNSCRHEAVPEENQCDAAKGGTEGLEGGIATANDVEEQVSGLLVSEDAPGDLVWTQVAEENSWWPGQLIDKNDALVAARQQHLQDSEIPVRLMGNHSTAPNIIFVDRRRIRSYGTPRDVMPVLSNSTAFELAVAEAEKLRELQMAGQGVLASAGEAVQPCIRSASPPHVGVTMTSALSEDSGRKRVPDSGLDRWTKRQKTSGKSAGRIEGAPLNPQTRDTRVTAEFDEGPMGTGMNPGGTESASIAIGMHSDEEQSSWDNGSWGLSTPHYDEDGAQSASEGIADAAETQEGQTASEVRLYMSPAHGREPADEDDNDSCVKCSECGTLILCDGANCDAKYHLGCLDPPLTEVPPGNWYCPLCSMKRVTQGVHAVCDMPDSVWGKRLRRPVQSSASTPLPGIGTRAADFLLGDEFVHTMEVVIEEDEHQDAAAHVPSANSRNKQVQPDVLSRRADGRDPQIRITNDALEPHVASEEYFVKWKGLSHLHNSWVEERWFDAHFPGIVAQFKERASGMKALRWRPQWAEAERLLEQRQTLPPVRAGSGRGRGNGWVANWGKEWLVKWKGRGYEHCTWEPVESSPLPFRTLEASHLAMLEAARLRSDPARLLEAERRRDVEPANLARQPEGLQGGGTLWPHQLSALNWLRQCWHLRTGAILADDEGLGKAVTTVAFAHSLAHEMGVPKPFLLVVPSRKLHVWEAHLATWAPSLYSVTFAGSRETRNSIRRLELNAAPGPFRAQLVLTTTAIASQELAFLRSIQWGALMAAHSPQGIGQELFGHYAGLTALFRLLVITLASLQAQCEKGTAEMLAFVRGISPSQLADIPRDTASLEQLLQPHVLRRTLDDVKPPLATLQEVWVPAVMSQMQVNCSRDILVQNKELLVGYKGGSALAGIHTLLRKCCDHPYLVEKQKTLPSPTHSGPSGKLRVLDALLPALQGRGMRVLILSQVAAARDLLDLYLRKQYEAESYFRLHEEEALALQSSVRQRLSSVQLILASPRACSLGLDLDPLQAVVLFGMSSHAQRDHQMVRRLQAGSRTSQPLTVFRLYTVGSVEERALDLLLSRTAAGRAPCLANCLCGQCTEFYQDVLQWHAMHLSPVHQQMFKNSIPQNLVPGAGTNPSQATCSTTLHKSQNTEQSYGKDNMKEQLARYYEGSDPPPAVAVWGVLNSRTAPLPPAVSFWQSVLPNLSQSKDLQISPDQCAGTIQGFSDVVPLHPLDRPTPPAVQSAPERGVFPAATVPASGGGETIARVQHEPPAADERGAPAVVAAPPPSPGRVDKREAQRILIHAMAKQMSQLCHELRFPEKVRECAVRHLQQLQDFRLSPAPSLRAAVVLALCWLSAEEMQHPLDRDQSMEVARQHTALQSSRPLLDSFYHKLLAVCLPSLPTVNGSSDPKGTRGTANERTTTTPCSPAQAPEGDAVAQQPHASTEPRPDGVTVSIPSVAHDPSEEASMGCQELLQRPEAEKHVAADSVQEANPEKLQSLPSELPRQFTHPHPPAAPAESLEQPPADPAAAGEQPGGAVASTPVHDLTEERHAHADVQGQPTVRSPQPSSQHQNQVGEHASVPVGEDSLQPLPAAASEGQAQQQQHLQLTVVQAPRNSPGVEPDAFLQRESPGQAEVQSVPVQAAPAPTPPQPAPPVVGRLSSGAAQADARAAAAPPNCKECAHCGTGLLQRIRRQRNLPASSSATFHQQLQQVLVQREVTPVQAEVMRLTHEKSERDARRRSQAAEVDAALAKEIARLQTFAAAEKAALQQEQEMENRNLEERLRKLELTRSLADALREKSVQNSASSRATRQVQNVLASQVEASGTQPSRSGQDASIAASNSGLHLATATAQAVVAGRVGGLQPAARGRHAAAAPAVLQPGGPPLRQVRRHASTAGEAPHGGSIVPSSLPPTLQTEHRPLQAGPLGGRAAPDHSPLGSASSRAHGVPGLHTDGFQLGASVHNSWQEPCVIILCDDDDS